MATPVFPSTIPGVVMHGLGFKPEQSFVRTDMESGPARQRRRFSAAPTIFTVSWTFTRAQLAVFEKFYDVDLAGGTNWFNVNLPNGMGNTTYTARFKEPYNAQTAAREFYWSVTGSLEVLARPLLA
jgi:hypothetical protein